MDDHVTGSGEERVFNPLQIVCLNMAVVGVLLAMAINAGIHWLVAVFAAGFGGAVVTILVAVSVCAIRDRRSDRRRRRTTGSARAAAEMADPLVQWEEDRMADLDRALALRALEGGPAPAALTGEETLRLWDEDADKDAAAPDDTPARFGDGKVRAARR